MVRGPNLEPPAHCCVFQDIYYKKGGEYAECGGGGLEAKVEEVVEQTVPDGEGKDGGQL